MKIAIVGIGGVGGYFGGMLAKKYSGNPDVKDAGMDVEIVFVARGGHLDKIRGSGLKLISVKEECIVHPHLATDDPSGCGVFDLILYCVKGYDLLESVHLIAPCIGENTTVVSLLNGVDNAEKLKSILGKGRVLNGCVYISSHIAEPGVVQQVGGPCKLYFGSEADESIDWKPIEQTLIAADIDAEYRKDINSIVWEKFLFISPFASATTFVGQTIGGLLDDVEGSALLEALIDEVVAVARKEGIDLADNIKQATLEKARNFPPETRTSMEMDFEKGKKAEIETFTGFVVQKGRMHGLDLPHHEKVYDELTKRL